MIADAGSNAWIVLISASAAAVVAGLFSFVNQRWLVERKAQLDFELPMRQKLLEALAPLQPQLLFASRDLARRVQGHARGGVRWNLNPSDYYAKSFMWRILRPLAVGLLIERQMAVADFSLDPSKLILLRYKAAMWEMLTGSAIVIDNRKVDWATQSDHLFSHNLDAAAAKLLTSDENGADRVMDSAQFVNEVPDPLEDPALRDLAKIFAKCHLEGTLLAKPIFWLRIVGQAYVGHTLLLSQGPQLGFQVKGFDVEQLLAAVPDEYISSRAAEYQTTFDSIINESL